MHAVFVVSRIDASRIEEAEAALRNGIGPMVENAPGFVSATFGRSADGTQGRSCAVFESEAQAKSMIDAALAGMPADGPIQVLEHYIFPVTLRLG